MPTSRTLWHWLLYHWQGPRDLSRPLRLEWRLVAIRWLGILFVGPGLLLLPLGPERQLGAYAVLGFAAVYNLVIRRMILRGVKLTTLGLVTTICDSVLSLGFLYIIGGGFSSPYAVLLFSVTVSVAMRYGYSRAIAQCALYVVTDAVESLIRYHHIDSVFVFFSGYLFIVAVLGSYLREEASRAEAALQERLRQADLLNEATGLLAASLEFEPLLEAVADAAARLFGGECAVLQPAAALHEAGFRLPASIACPPEPMEQHDELLRLCAVAAGEEPDGDGSPLWQRATLASGTEAIVLALTSPTRQATLAVLALAFPRGRRVGAVDPDVLESFADRAALAIENASLYRTVAKSSADLQRAYGDLASAHQELLSVDEMKTNFLANVSHELRTPLTSIRSFSELLLSYDDPAVRQEFLQIINAESERLTRLVNDVLDITKIESGYMEWHTARIDLAALLAESARVFEPTIAERGLAFVLDLHPDLPTVDADADRIQQVLSNLLNNALKFTAEGVITLRATIEGDAVHVAVTDTGIGIPADDQERIFEKFQQVGAVLTDKPKGTGLGLPISRDIIAYHQGRLWVESALGQGSTFSFSLPIPASEPVEPALAVA